MPAHFVLTRVVQNNQELPYDPATHGITLPRIAGGEAGEIRVEGYFSRALANTLAGDQQTEFKVTVSGGVESRFVDGSTIFIEGSGATEISVVNPRVELAMGGSSAVNFGETAIFTITANNVGDRRVEQISLRASLSGSPLSASGANASVASPTSSFTSFALGSANGTLALPVIDALEVGQSATITLRLPTAVLAGNQVSASVSVAGEARSPEIDTVIPITAVSREVRFNSQVSAGASVFYFGPNFEQLGYGPYPPVAWEVTAFRVGLRISNLNNPLTNVRIQTTLPGQVDWTGFSSVTAGTTIGWDPASRTVTWQIPRLDPQSQAVGAQFEVRFLPNHLQVGQSPQIIQATTITAQDSFTGSTIVRTLAPVASPAPVQPEP
jgi:hypothetical protein